MTDKETAKIMAVLKAAYPRYYHAIGDKEARETIALWHSMLSEYSYELVSKAVKALIATEKFVPTIADVTEKINLIINPAEFGEVEAWGLVKRAIKNGYYNSKEEFEKLPILVKKAIGSHEVIREWSQVNVNDIETVIGSNFMRAYRAKQKAEKEQAMLPSDVKEFISITARKLDMNNLIEKKEDL